MHKYKITEALNIDGFSINSVHTLIKRNKNSRVFNIGDYFDILIVMEDMGLVVDKRKYALSTGDLAFIAPQKDIVFDAKCENEGSAYIIAFSASFYERSAKDSLLLNSELYFDCSSSKITIVRASIPTSQIKQLIVDRLSLYQAKNNHGLYVAAAHNSVEVLLLEGFLYVNEKSENEEHSKKFIYLDLTNKFWVLLQKHYKQERQVAFYADQLYITPRKLSRMTEAALGKSAKQVIIDKIVSESIRMLRYSSFTISEIAYELGFNDEGNFSTFIKTHTRKNPSELRE